MLNSNESIAPVAQFQLNTIEEAIAEIKAEKRAAAKASGTTR